MRTIPACLHVLLARDGPTAVVMRRGPTRHVAFIGWDRRTDRFTVAQWLHGRIYERRSDLSPDGEHLIYFAMNGRFQSSQPGSWTAVSRAPYLKALTLFAKGDCYNGGGLFLSPREYWLNGSGHEVLHDASGLKCLPKRPWPEDYGSECPGVYYHRLARDGWARLDPPGGARRKVTVFERRAPGPWLLRKFAHAGGKRALGQGVYFDEHQLWNPRTGAALDFPQWEWAEVDGERLLWADGGKLYAARLGEHGLTGARELFDFNPLQFEELVAPY